MNYYFLFFFPEEEWRDVVGYEGLYMVSNLGRVKSLPVCKITRTGKKRPIQEKILKGYICIGYRKVGLTDWDGNYKVVSVHRIVAKAFIPNPYNLPQINHLNENKDDNRVENLEWSTVEHNINWGTRTERSRKTLSIPIEAIRISDGKVFWFESRSEAKRQGFSPTNVSKRNVKRTLSSCKETYYWKYADDPDYTIPNYFDKRLSIKAISVNGESTMYFKSLRDADRHGFSRASVKDAVDSGKMYKNYYWLRN